MDYAGSAPYCLCRHHGRFSALRPGTAADDEVTVYKRAVEKSFAAWLEALWPDAEAARRQSRKTFDAKLKGLKLDWSLPHLV